MSGSMNVIKKNEIANSIVIMLYLVIFASPYIKVFLFSDTTRNISLILVLLVDRLGQMYGATSITKIKHSAFNDNFYQIGTTIYTSKQHISL